MARLNGVDAHCAAVLAAAPPNPTFLDETLRGFVLHLSAHFQGFCRDLYTECSQIWIGAIPAAFKATAQAQFSAHLALEKGNPSTTISRETSTASASCSICRPPTPPDRDRSRIWGT
jgi:hypothetical protein